MTSVSHATEPASLLPELGFYTLAGHSNSPRDLLGEVRTAEEIGLGAAFISERFNLKDACALSGAAGAVSERIGIATGATNHNTRHPLITATFGTTMYRMTGGRFALGLGRGFGPLFDIMGLPRVTSAQLEDVAGILRTLWHGGSVVGHDGPAGTYPFLNQDAAFDEHIPIMLVAIGERTLELAGRIADGVILHTFFTDDTLARSVAAVRRGEEIAGREPGSTRIWSVLATISDDIADEEVRLRKLVGRLASYMQGYGDVLVAANGWDPEVLVRFRAHELVQGARGALDATAGRDELETIATLFPPEWLEASATGSPEECARRVADQFAIGADSVILHGATPAELAPVVAAYRAVRPEGPNRARPANPGWMR